MSKRSTKGIKPGFLVEVELDDSIGENTGWFSVADFDYGFHDSGVHIKAAGYFMRIYKNSLYISQIRRDEDNVGARALAIPIAAITKIRRVDSGR